MIDGGSGTETSLLTICASMIRKGLKYEERQSEKRPNQDNNNDRKSARKELSFVLRIDGLFFCPFKFTKLPLENDGSVFVLG